MDKDSILSCMQTIPNSFNILQALQGKIKSTCFVMVSVLHSDCLHLFYRDTDISEQQLHELQKLEPHIMVSLLTAGTPNPRAVTLKEVLCND